MITRRGFLAMLGAVAAGPKKVIDALLPRRAGTFTMADLRAVREKMGHGVYGPPIGRVLSTVLVHRPGGKSAMAITMALSRRQQVVDAAKDIPLAGDIVIKRK